MEAHVLSARAWAEAEFANSKLGDERLDRRLLSIATAFADAPGGTFPGVFRSKADLFAAYDFFAHPHIPPEAISQPHRSKTLAECHEPGHYLLIEDTSDLDFSSKPSTRDLGWINDGGGRGFHLHSNLAFRIEGWDNDHAPVTRVIGLVHQHAWTRFGLPKSKAESKAERLSRPRESERWAAVFDGLPVLPGGVTWTYVADRESDIFEVFQRCRAVRVGWIIRSMEPRALLSEGGSVFDAVARGKKLGTYEIKLRARPGRKARVARIEVRSAAVVLRGAYRPGGRLDPEPMNVVEAREIDAPPGIEPLHWVLLTTWPCQSFEEARRVIATYGKRWLIEEYHKCLKTGVGMEESQLKTAERLLRLLAVLSIVAVRLLSMKLLSASHPEEKVDEEAIGAEAIKVLESQGTGPKEGWTSKTLLHEIAKLGGFLGRKSDGNPGWLTIWRGWQRLRWMALGAKLAGGP